MKPNPAFSLVATGCIAPPSIHDQTKIDYLLRILGYYTDLDNPAHRAEATIIASMIEDYCERVTVARDRTNSTIRGDAGASGI
jgi:hypothetical protein